MNKKVLFVTIVYIAVLLLILGIDYYNVLSFITSKLNYNYLSIFIGTITTIYLFWITYYLIDKKISDNEKEKKNNKQNALLLMLSETYKSCEDSLKTFNDDIMLIKYIVPKVDFNATIDPFIEQQKSYVFKYDNKILELVSDGVVDKKILKQYINIRDTFGHYINMKVTLFDIDSPKYNGDKKVENARKEFALFEKKLKTDLAIAVDEITNRTKE